MSQIPRYLMNDQEKAEYDRQRRKGELAEFQSMLPDGWTIEQWYPSGVRIKDGKRISITLLRTYFHETKFYGTEIITRRNSKIVSQEKKPIFIGDEIRAVIADINCGKYTRKRVTR